MTALFCWINCHATLENGRHVACIIASFFCFVLLSFTRCLQLPLYRLLDLNKIPRLVPLLLSLLSVKEHPRQNLHHHASHQPALAAAFPLALVAKPAALKKKCGFAAMGWCCDRTLQEVVGGRGMIGSLKKRTASSPQDEEEERKERHGCGLTEDFSSL
ncbi:hypothetical protein BD289DRAFT_446951 [Coniella lustricola]|uniref:Uncharacterized protein n=1 Tax=Coniella lustricola TaxID=2025994 RepID=A0A2T2ZTI5_9PEZI|nr:hypothetical protein BD289DRAFT_446951 [Coniella lustricola]